MAGFAMGVWSVFTGVVGLVGFFQHEFASQPSNQDSALRVAVGLDNPSQGVTGMDGTRPLVMAYDANQVYIGTNGVEDDGNIPSGSFADLTISQFNGPGEQAQYLKLIAWDNAICIAYLTQTWADGTKRGWIGDWGASCNQPWYYSNVVVGDGYKPACTWMDGDHTNDISLGGFQVYMQAFTNLTGVTPDQVDPSTYCYWPILDFYSPEQINTATLYDFWDFWPDNRVSRNKRAVEDQERAADRKLGPLNALSIFPATPNSRRDTLNRIIVSSDARHTATQLCESYSSTGPDFVSIAENLYCDMDLKRTFTICSDERQGDCYDLNSRSLRASLLTGRFSKRDVLKIHDNLVQWN